MIYFTRGLGIAPGVGDIIAETHIDFSAGTTQSFFYIQNHRGDTVALVDESGEVVGTYEYNAWGEIVAHSGQDAYFTFSSKHFDQDAKLYYYGFRWYDSVTKRWTQPDPSGLDEGLDLYRFCDNDPVNSVDVYGLWSMKAIADSVRDYRQSVKDYIWINTGNVWADTALNGFSGTMVDMSTGGLGTDFVLNSVDRYHQNYCELNNNKFWVATDALNLALGDIVGYTMLLEGAFGVDRASLAMLSTGERWFRGVAGGVQTAFFVVGAAEGLHMARGKFHAPKTTAVQKYWPENNGFIGTPKNKTLMPGKVIDRYGGSKYSRFFSPENTPIKGRSLPSGTATEALHTYKILKPLEVKSGTVAPAFGQPGLGTQYRTPVTLETLLKRGFIEKLN